VDFNQGVILCSQVVEDGANLLLCFLVDLMFIMRLKPISVNLPILAHYMVVSADRKTQSTTLSKTIYVRSARARSAQNVSTPASTICYAGLITPFKAGRHLQFPLAF
jgi:hypothetical protein